MDLNNLTPISKNSVRGSNQNYDIHHFAEENKFTVSDAIYAMLGLNNHGFTAFINNQENVVLLAVLPNEDAVSYKGREGYDKGKVFTSTEMSKAFSKFGLEGELSLTKEGTIEGTDYYLVSEMSDNSEAQEEQTTEELTSHEQSNEIENQTESLV